MSNFYKKYAPNVYVAACSKEHKKGDVITVTTKRGKENEHYVHNFVGYTKQDGNVYHCYSITRVDGYNAQEHAKKKVEKYEGWADSAKKKSMQHFKDSQEGKDFLSLGEPIKIGHHSEKRHRALIERNNNRMRKSIEEGEKANAHLQKADYWRGKENTINLSMPESIEFYKYKLDEAKRIHAGMKDGMIKREHSFSLTYAKKNVNKFTKLLQQAEKLWK